MRYMFFETVFDIIRECFLFFNLLDKVFAFRLEIAQEVGESLRDFLDFIFLSSPLVAAHVMTTSCRELVWGILLLLQCFYDDLTTFECAFGGFVEI